MEQDKHSIIAPAGKSIGHPLERRQRRPMAGFNGINQSRASIDSELRIPLPATALVVVAMLTADEKQAFEEHIEAARAIYGLALQRMSVTAGARQTEVPPAAATKETKQPSSEVESARIQTEPEISTEPSSKTESEENQQQPTTIQTTDESTARESDGTERNSDPSEHPDEVRTETEPRESTEPVQGHGTEPDAQGAVTETDNSAVQAALLAAMGASEPEPTTPNPNLNPTTNTDDHTHKQNGTPRRKRGS